MDHKKGVDHGDSNPDPITGEPGAHPVGVAAGGSGGAMAGAAIGAIGGPIGALVGGAIGAVAGGLAGKGVAESVNPTDEDNYWRETHSTRPYVKSGHTYDDYQPAYRYGWETAAKPQYTGRSFDEVEPELSSNWSTYRGNNPREWHEVRDASRDAYTRVSSRMAGGAGMAAGSSLGHGVTTWSELGNSARNTADYASDKGDAVWEQVKGNWHQFKGSVKAKWNDLTDDEIEQMEGNQERIIGKIQEKYGEAKWKRADIENEFRSFRR